MIGRVSGAAAQALRWRLMQLAGVQGIYFLRLLILAKLLAPDAFGLVAIALIAQSVLLRLSDVGMIPALVQRREVTTEEQDAAWSVGLVRAAFVAFALVAAAPAIAQLFDAPAAEAIIQVLALRPLVDAGASIGVARLTRELRFRPLAMIQLAGASADLVTAAATAPALGVWALVAGGLAGSFVMTCVSYVCAPHRPRLGLEWRTIAPLVHFGRWVLLAGVATLAGTLAIQLGVSRALGATALGLYFLALKLAFLPVDAAAAVVGSVALPMFARLQGEPEATTRSFALLLSGLGLVLIPAYALLIAVAPLFEAALGARWLGTAPIIRILSLAGAAAILADLLGPLLLGQGRAARVFLLELVQAAVTIALLWPALALYQVQGAAFACLAGNVAALAVAVAWTRRLLPGALRAVRQRLLAALLAAVAAAGVAPLAAQPWNGFPALVVGAAAGAAAAIGVLWWLNARLALELGDFRALLQRVQS